MSGAQMTITHSFFKNSQKFPHCLARVLQILRVGVSQRQFLSLETFLGQMSFFSLRNSQSPGGATQINTALTEKMPQQIIALFSQGTDARIYLTGVIAVGRAPSVPMIIRFLFSSGKSMRWYHRPPCRDYTNKRE